MLAIIAVLFMSPAGKLFVTNLRVIWVSMTHSRINLCMLHAIIYRRGGIALLQTLVKLNIFVL